MQDEDAFQPDRPTLILGLIGFPREAATAVENVLAARRGEPVEWRLGALAEADAWWASGARTQLLADGSLRIGAGEPGGRSVRLSLADVQRPVAFSEPLAAPDFEPAYTFRIDEAATMAAMLATMESQWLAFTAARLWLAARLVESDGALTQRVYHIQRGGLLLAVIDRTGAIGLLPGVTVEHLEGAHWLGRPSSAAFIPPSFQRTTISELLWTYALRARTDLLPQRYRSGLLYFRRPPRIDQRQLGDDHLLVMRELCVGPATFDALQRKTGMDPTQLARTLGALYLTGSITSNQHRVPRAPVPVLSTGSGSRPRDESVWSPTGHALDGSPAAIAMARDFTVPAGLPVRDDAREEAREMGD